ncbi:MAG TPA: hypothetical protein VII97_03105, partial [Anaerolineales bacterium]
FIIIARQGTVVVNPCHFFCTLKIEISKKVFQCGFTFLPGLVPVSFREKGIRSAKFPKKVTLIRRACTSTSLLPPIMMKAPPFVPVHFRERES